MYFVGIRCLSYYFRLGCYNEDMISCYIDGIWRKNRVSD